MLRTRYAHFRERTTLHSSCVHWLVVAVVVGMAGMMLATNAVAASNDVEFNIPAQPVSSALRAYARQAHVQLLASTQGLDATEANAVVGRFEPQAALKMLLAGTGLQAQYRPDATVMVRRITEVSRRPAGSMDNETFTLPFSQANVEAGQQIIDLGTSETRQNTTSEDSEDAVKALEEIVVTGTQIRGAPPVGASVITLDREYIELSGLATTMELIQTLPQNFGGGANEDTTTVGVGPGTLNNGLSSSVNLRGLGTASTLLLLNGRRSASGGDKADFVDLNVIPTAAIKQIEVLPDGASAIYGSDAVGGVVNVILRDDYDGAETRLRYAPGTSDIDEVQFSQVFGKSWDTGNILLNYEYYDRSDLESADREYTRDSDLTRLGGTNHSVPASNPGNVFGYILADGSFQSVQLAIPSGQNGSSLAPTDLLTGVTNLQNRWEGTSVLPEQRKNSVFVALSQELSSTIDLFLEARYSTREFEMRNQLAQNNVLQVPNSNPFFVDPFGGSPLLFLNYSTVDDYGATRSSGDVDTLGATLGAAFSLGNSWEVEIYGSHNVEDTDRLVDRLANRVLLAAALADDDPNTAFNPFGDGSSTSPATLAAIEGFIKFDNESELMVFNVHADGDLFEMPGGAAKLAIGAQFRDDSFVRNHTNFSNTPEPVPETINFDVGREVTAAFAEIYLPVVTDQNSRPGINRLAVSIAARYENYSDFGDTFDPKFGVSWSPNESLTLHSTVGTSFRAPLFHELDDSSRIVLLVTAPDPASPTGQTLALVTLGNRPDLAPEEGATWTAGFDVTPASLRSLKVGLTYFTTEVDHLIGFPGNNIFLPFQEPDIFASIFTRCPCDVAAVTALMNDPDFISAPVPPDQVGAIIDFRRGNFSQAKLSGLDLDVAYGFETGVGSFDLSLYASHLFEFKEQLADGPLIDNVDTTTKPVSLSLRSSLAWTYGGVNAGMFVNYIDDYTDTNSDPDRPISSWTTLDLLLGYDFGERYYGFLDRANVSLHVRNLFDTDPPFVDNINGIGYDAINANPMGRFLALQLTKAW